MDVSGRNSTVECQPSKLYVAGSIPVVRSNKIMNVNDLKEFIYWYFECRDLFLHWSYTSWGKQTLDVGRELKKNLDKAEEDLRAV